MRSRVRWKVRMVGVPCGRSANPWAASAMRRAWASERDSTAANLGAAADSDGARAGRGRRGGRANWSCLAGRPRELVSSGRHGGGHAAIQDQFAGDGTEQDQLPNPPRPGDGQKLSTAAAECAVVPRHPRSR